jgi:hypothetical protein
MPIIYRKPTLIHRCAPPSDEKRNWCCLDKTEVNGLAQPGTVWLCADCGTMWVCRWHGSIDRWVSSAGWSVWHRLSKRQAGKLAGQWQGEPPTAPQHDATPRKYCETLGDGVTKTFTVKHGLGSREISVYLHLYTTGFAIVNPSFSIIDEDTIAITTPSSNQYVVTVIAQ